jgi:hypothetical protein
MGKVIVTRFTTSLDSPTIRFRPVSFLGDYLLRECIAPGLARRHQQKDRPKVGTKHTHSRRPRVISMIRKSHKWLANVTLPAETIPKRLNR